MIILLLEVFTIAIGSVVSDIAGDDIYLAWVIYCRNYGVTFLAHCITLILYLAGNQTHILTAAPNNDVATDL